MLSSTPSTAGVASVGTQLVQNAPGADDGVVEESKEELPAAQQQYEEKLKKNYEDFMAIVEKESKKEIPMPPQKGTG